MTDLRIPKHKKLKFIFGDESLKLEGHFSTKLISYKTPEKTSPISQIFFVFQSPNKI